MIDVQKISESAKLTENIQKKIEAVKKLVDEVNALGVVTVTVEFKIQSAETK